MGQLSSGSSRILGNHLLQNAFDAVGVTETALYVSELVQRIRHLGVLRVQLRNLGERLTCALQITFGQVDFAQPVLGITRVLAVRVFAQERGESLTGLVEILGLDQVEGCVVIELFLRRVGRFVAGCRGLLGRGSARSREEYSRELSKKMNLAHQKRQQNNGKPVLTSKSYGYRRTADGAIEIIPEEAAVKRRMYELCADGLGGRKIAAVLAAEGVRSRAGKPFSGTDIIRMVRNPMNKGTVVMNKKHYDFNTGKTLPTPPGGQYVYAGKIPAIVSEELWIAANRAADERLCRKKVGKSVQT